MQLTEPQCAKSACGVTCRRYPPRPHKSFSSTELADRLLVQTPLWFFKCRTSTTDINSCHKFTSVSFPLCYSFRFVRSFADVSFSENHRAPSPDAICTSEPVAGRPIGVFAIMMDTVEATATLKRKASLSPAPENVTSKRIKGDDVAESDSNRDTKSSNDGGVGLKPEVRNILPPLDSKERLEISR